MNQFRFLLILFLLFIFFAQTACRKHYTPKPRGYPRIDLPRHSYIQYKKQCPFTFSYPIYASVSNDSSRLAEPCWLNIDYPMYKARIHLSYKSIHGNLGELLEDSHTFVYDHVSMADAIDETVLSFPEQKAYGIFYDIKGNAASSLQFFITDSIHHFLRGALYFHMKPNYDSLTPVILFIRQDMMRLVATLEWSK